MEQKREHPVFEKKWAEARELLGRTPISIFEALHATGTSARQAEIIFKSHLENSLQPIPGLDIEPAASQRPMAELLPIIARETGVPQRDIVDFVRDLKRFKFVRDYEKYLKDHPLPGEK